MLSEETWRNMEVNWKAVKKNYRKYDGRVMFPSSHDIVDDPEILEACIIVLEKLLNVGNEVLVTTKPDLDVIARIIDQFTEFKDQMEFRFTITSNSDDLLSFWEPNAPPFLTRKEALILAFKEGFKTSLSIEPFLDDTPYDLIDELEEYVTESIWVGPMNYIGKIHIDSEGKRYYDAIRKNTDPKNLMEIYETLKDNPKIKFKDSLLNRIQRIG
ncbi:MAG: hypothetical protein ACTSR3_23770 [Candidatus Helarchaeota archaeon]